MSTTLHSFMDIFETTIEDGDTSVQLNKIVIPLIQRDYAQGRIDKALCNRLLHKVTHKMAGKRWNDTPRIIYMDTPAVRHRAGIPLA